MIMTSKSSSSFSVFKEVDESVSKPVIGSDGAARWQDFKVKNSKLLLGSGVGGGVGGGGSVAPALPLKKLDRVALGTTSIHDERTNESKIRKEAGDRELGAGYTTFKRKTNMEEIAERKRKKLVMDRVRPDDVPYFMEAETFEGYKFDYVFTTRDTRGTGYYWDGMDSLKKELGQETTNTHTSIDNENANDNDKGATAAAGAAAGATVSKTTSKEGIKGEIKVKKKKKKNDDRHQIFMPDEVGDEFNPMEQVALAIQRRSQAMSAPPSSFIGGGGDVSAAANTMAADAAALGVDARLLNHASSSTVASTTPSTTITSQSLEPELVVAGWESALDPASGKTFYFRRSTNERRWDKPTLSANEQTQQQLLPDGWKSALDAGSGQTYYYHTSGKTSWEKPI
ncbi:hypothetical protein ACHAWU_001119 [Discostella pseudostelligera]|uniref:WW domain-containing protein n=1 Tax=Discostella pseudostelligera TaxID=259834 RepID=A0ABD3MHB2_9STRA